MIFLHQLKERQNKILFFLKNNPHKTKIFMHYQKSLVHPNNSQVLSNKKIKQKQIKIKKLQIKKYFNITKIKLKIKKI